MVWRKMEDVESSAVSRDRKHQTRGGGGGMMKTLLIKTQSVDGKILNQSTAGLNLPTEFLKTQQAKRV